MAFVEEVIEDGKLDKRQALVLRGRLAFCDGFIFGRLGRVALQNITRHAYNVPFQTGLSPSLVDSLKLLRDCVLHGAPRQLTCKLLETMYLFTDASFELQKGAGLGAVLVSGLGQVISWLSLWVSPGDISLFLPEGRETAIGELETLAVAMPLFVWHQRLRSTQLVVYIDNEGAKFSRYSHLCSHSHLFGRPLHFTLVQPCSFSFKSCRLSFQTNKSPPLERRDENP